MPSEQVRIGIRVRGVIWGKDVHGGRLDGRERD